MGVPELLREVLKALDQKTRKTANRASLDALVYVNLRGRYLCPAPDMIEEETGAVAQLGWRSVSVLWPPYAAVLCAKPLAPRFLRLKIGRIVRYPGIPWEDAARPTEAASLTRLGRSTLATFAVAGYVALGGAVLAARAMRNLIGLLAAPLAHETWVVEAESATTGGWSIVSTCSSLADARARLSHLLGRFAGVPVFDRRRWRLRHAKSDAIVLGEL
jgi:hypothetical protein